MKTGDQTTTDATEAMPPGGVGLGAPPCLQYIPYVDIPEEVHAAARTLNIFFEKQGMREWEFSHLADRRLVTKLERERDEARHLAEAYRGVWEGCTAAVDECPTPDPLPWKLNSANDWHEPRQTEEKS